MKDATGELSMVQAHAPQGEASQDDMTLPMLDPEAKHSSSDANIHSAPKRQQRCSPPDVIEAAASGDIRSEAPDVSSLFVVFAHSGAFTLQQQQSRGGEG